MDKRVRNILNLNKVFFNGDLRELGHGVDFQFVHDIVFMCFHGFRANPQTFSNLFRDQTVGHQPTQLL